MTTTGKPNGNLFTTPVADDIPITGDDVPFTQADGFEPPKPPTKKKTRLRDDIMGLYAAMGLGIFPFDQYVGTLVSENAENCAIAWEDLAAKNPAVKRALESILTTGAYSAVIAAHMPIAVAVATKYIPGLREQYEAAFTAAAGGVQE